MNLKCKDITEKSIGASFDVHSSLGNGVQKVIYRRVLAWAMTQRELHFQREMEQPVYCKDLPQPIDTRRADFVVEEKVRVELKAQVELEDVHLAQTLNYIIAYQLPVGLLIHFGSKSLTFKRLVR